MLQWYNYLMVNNELLEYVKGARARGVNEETIRVVLKKNGWEDKDIDEAYAVLPREVLETEAPPSPKQFLSSNSNLPENPIIYASPNIRPKEKKRGTGFIFFLLLFFLIAIGVFGYIGYQKYFAMSPEERIINAVRMLGDIEGASVDGTITLNNNEIDFTGTARGAFYGRKIGELREEGTLSFELNYDPLKKSLLDRGSSTSSFFPPIIPLASSIQARVVIDLRLVESVLYLRLNEESRLGDIELDALQGQWIEIPLGQIDKLKNFREKSRYENFNNSLTREEVEAINQKYAGVNRIAIDEKGKIKDGEETFRRYVFRFTPEMHLFLKELYVESLIKQAATQSEIIDAVKIIEEAFQSIERHKGE